MSTAQEAPALIQYACERCKTRFVLPPSRRRLGLFGRFKAAGMAFSRMIRHREGLRSTYDGARRQLLAKLDDDAYQSFVQSFKFCHECRQFVCSECWSASRKTCLGCFAKAAGTTVKVRPPFSPTGPEIPRPTPLIVPKTRSRRLRTDAALLVLGAAVLLFAVELVFIYPRSTGAATASETPTGNVAVTSPSASPTATIAPSVEITATPTVEVTPSASPSPSPSPSASPSDSPSPSPSPSATTAPATPKPATPKPTFPNPAIKCNGKTGVFSVADGTSVNCVWSNPVSGYVAQWYHSDLGNVHSFTFDHNVSAEQSIYLKVNGKKSNTVRIQWNGS